MKLENPGQMKFFSELSDHQITAKEFFGTVLLRSLLENFGLRRVVISYFDTKGAFLSWTTPEGTLPDGDAHPYHAFAAEDVVRRRIYADAVRDGLTYFNTNPRLYASTDILPAEGYDDAPYVRFIEENFGSHFSVTMAFGINAYIRVAFFKTAEEGNFTAEETNLLNEIYVYIADSYKKFKKYEQAKIVKNIQDEVISLGEKAYLVTDDFMHVLSYNRAAEQALAAMLGTSVTAQLDGSEPCTWLPFLLGALGDGSAAPTQNTVQSRVIQGYIFNIYTYDQHYSNRIVDRYHWITIAQQEASPAAKAAPVIGSAEKLPLTPAEKKVAEGLYKGLSYKEIAAQLVISYHTVKKHVENIYAKCGVKSRYELTKQMEKR